MKHKHVIFSWAAIQCSFQLGQVLILNDAFSITGIVACSCVEMYHIALTSETEASGLPVS